MLRRMKSTRRSALDVEEILLQKEAAPHECKQVLAEPAFIVDHGFESLGLP